MPSSRSRPQAVPEAGDFDRGFHLGTDVDDEGGNNVPASVEAPDSAFHDLQNVYTFYQTAGRDASTLASTDFGSGKAGADGLIWYNDDVRFAGRVTESPPGVQFLVRKGALGEKLPTVRDRCRTGQRQPISGSRVHRGHGSTRPGDRRAGRPRTGVPSGLGRRDDGHAARPLPHERPGGRTRG